MEETHIKKNLSQNLIFLRKSKELTQGELAEKLNYSDKTVSKWENGDSLPDLETLYLISKFFKISLDSLISDDLQKTITRQKSKTTNQRINKIIITLLSVSLVWLIAVVAYVQFRIIFNYNIWQFFIWAIPSSLIVLLIFNCIWGRRNLNFLIISALVWTLLSAIHIQLSNIADVWAVYFIGIPLQIAIILWSQIKK